MLLFFLLLLLFWPVAVDPSIPAVLDEESKAKDQRNGASEVPSWMRMRVSLRWMYRLVDVEQEKRQAVSAHPLEVFMSDLIAGPEVNSVDVIEGAASLTSDASLLKDTDDSSKAHVYLCRRFYRHADALRPPKGTVVSFYPAKAKSIRELVPGELEEILHNPTLSQALYFKLYSGLPKPKLGASEFDPAPANYSWRQKLASSSLKKRNRRRASRSYADDDDDLESEEQGSSWQTRNRTSKRRKSTGDPVEDGNVNARATSKRMRVTMPSDSDDNYEISTEFDSHKDRDGSVNLRTRKISRDENYEESFSSDGTVSEDSEIVEPTETKSNSRGRHASLESSRTVGMRASARRASLRILQTTALLSPRNDDDGEIVSGLSEDGEETVDEGDDVANAGSNTLVLPSVAESEQNSNAVADALGKSAKKDESSSLKADKRQTDILLEVAPGEHQGISVATSASNAAVSQGQTETGNENDRQQKSPEDTIASAFQDLTSEQRTACRRNLPWIIEAMKQGVCGEVADKSMSDEMMATVVVDVLKKYRTMNIAES